MASFSSCGSWITTSSSRRRTLSGRWTSARTNSIPKTNFGHTGTKTGHGREMVCCPILLSARPCSLRLPHRDPTSSRRVCSVVQTSASTSRHGRMGISKQPVIALMPTVSTSEAVVSAFGKTWDMNAHLSRPRGRLSPCPPLSWLVGLNFATKSRAVFGWHIVHGKTHALYRDFTGN